MARRGDDALTARTAAAAPGVDAPFVLAFAEPEPVEAPRPPARTPIH